MANIAYEINVPKPCKVDAPVYDHTPHGWYAMNSIVVGDCVPVYRNSGGGVSSESLSDLKTAIIKSISNIDSRIADAENLKRQLKHLLSKIA